MLKWDRIENTDVNTKLMLSTERDGREEGLFSGEMWRAGVFVRQGLAPSL